MKKSIYKTKEEMPLFLTLMDVANLLGISRASAYELVRKENFPKSKSYKVARLFRGIDCGMLKLSRKA